MTRVRQVGERIEELLAVLRTGDGKAAATATDHVATEQDAMGPVGGAARPPSPAEAGEELVRLLVGLYGDGLARIVAALRAEGPTGAAILDRLAEDPLVESLLVLHDLHPLDVDTRIQRALDQVRPYLGSHAGGVRYLGVSDGVARLRLEGSCHGCPSSTVTVKLAIEDAVRGAAPEVSDVVVEGMTPPPSPSRVLLQIEPRPNDAGRPAGAATGPGGWVTLPPLGPPSTRPVATSAAGIPIVVCAVRGTLYAYRDACAACGSPIGDGSLASGVLTCRCGTRYDVCRAGAGLDDPTLRLDPLPLVSDSAGMRVAVPAAVAP